VVSFQPLFVNLLYTTNPNSRQWLFLWITQLISGRNYHLPGIQHRDPRFKIKWLFTGSSGVSNARARPAGQLDHSGPHFNCWQFAGVSGVSLQQELKQPIQEDDCKRNFGWNHQ
jgi:hypothetical protein